MYGFTKENLASTVKSFNASLNNDNVELINVEFNEGTGKSGKPYKGIKFTFRREDQGVVEMLNELKLEPTDTYLKPRVQRDGSTQSVAEQLEINQKSYNTYLFHIATQYNCDLEKLVTIASSSFKEYAIAYADIVNESKSGKCYLKTCKNKAGYTCLPDYVPFLRNMELGSPNFSYNTREKEFIDNAESTGVKAPVTELDSL